MPNNPPAIISAVITLTLLIVVNVILSFFTLIALNGFSERAGSTSLVASLVCQGIGVLLAVIIAWRLTVRLITKSNWSNVAAALVSALAGALVGAGFSVVAMIVSIFLAEQIR